MVHACTIPVGCVFVCMLYKNRHDFEFGSLKCNDEHEYFIRKDVASFYLRKK